MLKEISSATASRDLKYGVEVGLILKEGNKRTTKYEDIKKGHHLDGLKNRL